MCSILNICLFVSCLPNNWLATAMCLLSALKVTSIWIYFPSNKTIISVTASTLMQTMLLFFLLIDILMQKRRPMEGGSADATYFISYNICKQNLGTFNTIRLRSAAVIVLHFGMPWHNCDSWSSSFGVFSHSFCTAPIRFEKSIEIFLEFDKFSQMEMNPSFAREHRLRHHPRWKIVSKGTSQSKLHEICGIIEIIVLWSFLRSIL